MNGRAGALDALLLPRVLRAHARHLGTKPALIDAAGTTTFAQLWDGAAVVAGALCQLGVRRGDRVALALEPSAGFVQTLLGVQALGAVAAPINTRLAAPEIVEYCARLGPQASIDALGLLDLAGIDRLVVDPANPVRSLDELSGGHGRDGIGPLELRAGDAAIAFPTGGTTGLPKSAEWSHGGLAMGLASACIHLNITRADVELFFSPVYHLTLVSPMLAVLLAGGTVHMMRRFDEEQVTRILASGGISRFFGTPIAIERILAATGERGPLPDSLRMVVFGASRSSPDFPARLQSAIPSARLMTGYGATEFGAVTRVYPDEVLSPLAGVGRPVAGVDLRICDADGGDVAEGESGEIAVRSPMAMLGYRGGETARILDGGFIASGDIGALDDEGRLHLRGRRSEIIKTGGESVHPAEVERAVIAHESVLDAVVYGVDDDRWGERIECAIIAAPGARPDEEVLRAFCATQVARFKVPKRFVVVDHFPHTSTMKVDRAALRRAAGAAPVARS